MMSSLVRSAIGGAIRRSAFQSRPASSLVPIVIEQTGRGERSYDIYSRLLKVYHFKFNITQLKAKIL